MKYLVETSNCLDFEKGQIVELSPKMAAFLKNKVRPVNPAFEPTEMPLEAEAEPQAKAKPKAKPKAKAGAKEEPQDVMAWGS